MRAGMVVLSAGIACAALLPVSGDPALVLLVVPGIVLSALLLSLYCLSRSRRARPAIICLILLCLFLLGLCWALFRAGWHAGQLLPEYLDGRDFWVSGTVVSLPRGGERYRQFAFRVESSCYALLPQDCPQGSGEFRRRRIMLNDYSGLEIRPGQQWRLRVRLRRPHASVNPYSIDYEARLFQRRISATGYVRETAFNRGLGERSTHIDALRSRLLEQIQLPPRFGDQEGLVHALVTGQREGISAEQWQRFSATGTNHLVVISGLHVGFVAWMAWWLASVLMRAIPSLLLYLPAQRSGAMAAMAAAFFYAALAGFSLPTQRALVMVMVFMWGSLSGRCYPASLGLLTALTAVLMMDPLSVLSAGFWLSFMAVASLLLGFTGQYSQAASAFAESAGSESVVTRLWFRWGRAQWLVFLGLATPLMVWMQQLSLVSPLANILAIPLVSLLVVPLSLAGAAALPLHQGLALSVLQWAAQLLAFLEAMLDWLLEVAGPLALWQVHQIGGLSAALAALACLLFLLPRGWPDRYLGLVLLLPVLWPQPSRPEAGTAEVQLMDAGQGLAVVVRTRTHTLVYDTGPWSAGMDMAERVMVPYLRRHGTATIDTLVISHWHGDHSGGLETLRGHFEVGRLLAGSLPEPRQEFSACRAGQQWQWDAVRFLVLHPGERHYVRENDNSCVLLLQAGEQRLLLSGDIEAAAERDLLARHENAALQADALLVPHHGSDSSSGDDFVAAVAPSLALWSAARHNRYSHPSPAVVQRYRGAGALVLGTADSGAMSLVLGGESAVAETLEQHRRDRPRYWRSR